MGRFFDIVTLVVGGIIVADLVSHGSDTVNILSGINGVWRTSVNGMLGKTS